MRLVTVAPNPAIDRLYELDRLVRDAVNRPVRETWVAGGKGLNVARVARALGAEVTSVALLAGHAGHWMADTLAGEGIPTRIAWASGETRTCLAIYDAADGTLTELNEAGPTVSPTEWTGLEDAVRAELASGDAGLLTISGSLPPGAPDDAIARIARLAVEAGVPVALDGSGPALLAALATSPWLVKLNAAEAATTLGRPVATDDAAAELLARALVDAGGGTVVLTRGAAGALAVDAGGHGFVVSPPAVRGPFPVGSGDAFLAGLAAGRLRGDRFDDALRLAAAAAAANAAVRGAGRLDPGAVEGLMAEVVVTEIAA